MKLRYYSRDELGGAVYSAYGTLFDHEFAPGAISALGFRVRGILRPELVRSVGEIGEIRVMRQQLQDGR